MTYCYCPSHPHKEDDIGLNEIVAVPVISTHIPTRRMTLCWLAKYHTRNISTHILTRRMTCTERMFKKVFELFNSHPHEEDDRTLQRNQQCIIFSTHILTRRMTAILNKIFSFKIKLYIHYNILFAIFYIYNSILYPFSSQKYSYSGANDSANSCSLAFRTPRFPVPSLQIHFP